jgi:hypothetical protein
VREASGKHITKHAGYHHNRLHYCLSHCTGNGICCFIITCHGSLDHCWSELCSREHRHALDDPLQHVYTIAFIVIGVFIHGYVYVVNVCACFIISVVDYTFIDVASIR